MLDASTISLIALGGAALFGLQGSISLAVRHNIDRELQQRSACDRVALSKEANIANIPVAYGAVIFYGLVLFLLFRGMNQPEIPLLWLNSAMVAALIVTCYYAYVMFFRLNIVCMGCLRIYLANLMMAAALLAYQFN